MRRFICLISLIFSFSLLSWTPTEAVTTNPTATCTTNCIINFAYSGDYYQWTAPVSGNYTFELWGAQGGNAQYSGTVNTYGGMGGYATGTKSLTSGQILYIYVGGQGTSSTNSLSDSLSGGWNGGGNGWNGSTTSYRGSGGGGASDIRLGGTALTDRFIVAGAGGGGVYFSAYGTNYPGAGGGLTGLDGTTGNYPSTGYNYSGRGGTQSAGGTGGTNGSSGLAGASGLGGNTNYYSGGYGEGGGGAGYFGGGGSGTGMASGGGSSYVAGVTSGSTIAGNASMPNPSGGTMNGRSGNGYIRITYSLPAGTVTLATAGNSLLANKGSILQLSSVINLAGNVTFLADGKKIAGCVSKPSSAGTVTCNWKPTTQKSVKLTAVFIPTGGQSVTSSSLLVTVSRRTNTR